MRVVIKVAILGEPKTGKTSIIRRYVDGKFLADTKNDSSRSSNSSKQSGIDFRQKLITIVGQQFSYEIWDVPNWTLLENLGSDFWRDVSGCVLVFDVTKASTFCIFDKLYASVSSILTKDNVPMVIAGNATDKGSSARAVSAVMAEGWCKNIGAVYFDVSAKCGSGVDEMFSTLAEKAVLFYHHQHLSDQVAV